MNVQFPDRQTERPPGSNLTEYTVGEIARAVRRTLENSFSRVRVRGEIGRSKLYPSGHLYFTLKDAESAIDGVIWRTSMSRISLRPEEGMEVICTGRVSSYPKNSRYQLVVDAVELAGEGALLKLLEERRRKLAAEGLFDPERKRNLPFLPDVIGVATSPAGAVIRDILHRLSDRFPRHVLLWPVPVQGDGAAEKIAAAIEGFNSLRPGGAVPRPDVLIVARGGGSLEDLWPFNEEILVRAAASSDIPLISAVGHETDTTLIDHAADHRAPTPTAAAERAVPVRAELHTRLLEDEKRLRTALLRMTAERRTVVEALSRGLPRPDELLENAMQTLDYQTDRIGSSIRRRLESARSGLAVTAAGLRHPRDIMSTASRELGQLDERLAGSVRTRLQACVARFETLQAEARMGTAFRNGLTASDTRLRAASALLEGLSVDRVLERGYALVEDSNARPVTKAAATRANQKISIRFVDDAVGAVILGETQTAGRRKSGGRKENTEEVSRQGTLF